MINRYYTILSGSITAADYFWRTRNSKRPMRRASGLILSKRPLTTQFSQLIVLNCAINLS